MIFTCNFGEGRLINALAWPAEKLPFAILAWTSSGNLSSRSVFVTVVLFFPTLVATSSKMTVNQAFQLGILKVVKPKPVIVKSTSLQNLFKE